MIKVSLFEAIDFFEKKSNKLYKKAVSDSFEILGVAPLVSEVANFVEKSVFVRPEEAAEIAQSKFNKLVSPYLNMEAANVPMTQDFEFYLHDLIHEAMKPGSVQTFIERDKKPGVYSRYSLQEYLDEDIAEYMTSRRYSGGLEVYIEGIPSRLNYLKLRESASPKEELISQVGALMSNDISSINDLNQKIFLEKIKKFFVRLLKNKEMISDSYNEMSLTHAFSDLIKDKLPEFYSKKQNTGETSKLLSNPRIASLIRRWLIALKKHFEDLELHRNSDPEFELAAYLETEEGGY